MRENRPYGSEGGAARKGRLYPYPGKCDRVCGDGNKGHTHFFPIEFRNKYLVIFSLTYEV